MQMTQPATILQTFIEHVDVLFPGREFFCNFDRLFEKNELELKGERNQNMVFFIEYSLILRAFNAVSYDWRRNLYYSY